MFYDNSAPNLPKWQRWEDDYKSTTGTTGALGRQGSAGYYRIRAGSPEVCGDEPESGIRLPLRAYERSLVNSVWEFAEVVPGNDSELWRRDEFGNWIYRLDYGNRASEFGWEIFDPGVGKHVQGVYAMRPMQWLSYIHQHEALG